MGEERTSSKQRHRKNDAYDSPDDSPEPSFDRVASRRAREDDHDDRPPTPVPEGFEGMVENETRVVQTSCKVQNHPPLRPREVQNAADTHSVQASNDASSGKRSSRSTEFATDAAAADRADLFFVEGVGWCDAYGRAVADTGGNSKVDNKEATARPKQSAAKLSSGTTRSSATTGSGARVSSNGRHAPIDA